MTSARTRRVLLAEDNYLAALEIEHVLGDMGFTVIGPVATPQDALARLTEVPDIEFAMLDVSLRGGTCAPVIVELRALGRPFILVTGYADPELGEACEGMPRPPIVRKPFSTHALLAAIEAVCREGPSGAG